MRLFAYQCLVALFVCCYAISGYAESAAAWRTFEFAGKMAFVIAGSDSNQGYELLVEENTLALARMEVNQQGVLNDAWRADLDSDGNPEIIVAIGQLKGTNLGWVDIHEWDGHKFSSVRVNHQLPIGDEEYSGHDQFSVSNGNLMREIPQFKLAGDSTVPTGKKLLYRYDMHANQWRPN